MKEEAQAEEEMEEEMEEKGKENLKKEFHTPVIFFKKAEADR